MPRSPVEDRQPGHLGRVDGKSLKTQLSWLVPTGRGLTMKLRTLPTRLVTGAYILHAGIGKWGGGPEQAAGIHAMASGAFPMLKSIDPPKFLRALSAAEIATGLVILTFVPAGLAGAALTGFSSGLVAMYLRTPS